MPAAAGDSRVRVRLRSLRVHHLPEQRHPVPLRERELRGVARVRAAARQGRVHAAEVLGLVSDGAQDCEARVLRPGLLNKNRPQRART
jgi:hypothetical protein